MVSVLGDCMIFAAPASPAWLPPHVADKVLNHQSGTISGVAAVYQRHEFLAERKDALERWGAHIASLKKLSLAA
jgi:hypothetical protein